MSPVMSFNTASSNPTLGREGHTQAIVQPVQAETAPAGSEALRAFVSRTGRTGPTTLGLTVHIKASR